MDRLIVSLLCLFDFFDGSFSVIQPKAPSAYNNIAFKDFELSNEKISRQNVSFGFFSVIQPQSFLAYIHIGGGILELFNEKSLVKTTGEPRSFCKKTTQYQAKEGLYGC